MASIGLHGVRLVHPDGTAALDGVDLEVADGELLGVVGPSGSGKTTLLRAVAGLEPVTAGSVWIGGRDVTQVQARERGLAMVAQEQTLYAFLDVAEQLAFPLELRRTDPEEVRRRTTSEGKAFGLGPVWHRRPRQLSAGEAQRTALARAMVRLPVGLLADEPLQLLDPPTAARVRADLVSLQRATAMTTVYTSNDHPQVLGIADRVAVLRAGRVVQVDRPEVLLAAPAETYVAGFVGEHPMRFLDVVVEEEGGLGWLRVGDGVRLRVPGGLPGPLRERVGSVVRLGARPGVVTGTEPADPVDQRLVGPAVEVLRFGVWTYVTVDLPRGSWVARFPGPAPVAVGDLVEVTVAVRRLSAFDPRGGRAVWHGDG